MTSHKTTQTMKPATAAKKLGVYLEATPAEFREGMVTREELNALQNDRLRAERKEAEESASALLKNITAACSAVEREMEEYMSSITLQNMIERIRDKESDSATRSQTPA